MGDDCQAGADKFQQGIIGDVSSGHNEQTSRRASQQVAVTEVHVFCDDDPTLCVSDCADLLVSSQSWSKAANHMDPRRALPILSP